MDRGNQVRILSSPATVREKLKSYACELYRAGKPAFICGSAPFHCESTENGPLWTIEVLNLARAA